MFLGGTTLKYSKYLVWRSRDLDYVLKLGPIASVIFLFNVRCGFPTEYRLWFYEAYVFIVAGKEDMEFNCLIFCTGVVTSKIDELMLVGRLGCLEWLLDLC